MSRELENAVGTARVIMDRLGVDIETAVKALPGLTDELREGVRERLEQERVIPMRDPTMLEDLGRPHEEWLHQVDRDSWYHWPRLRRYLIDVKSWPVTPTVRELDEATDRTLGAMENPRRASDFSVRGLAVGYVQSGKTANYSALIAKAADCGYRLFIVLTGVHNSLRQQTERRLDAELVGYINGVSAGVGPSDAEHTWHTFTNARLNGDFNAGNANAAALTGRNPVLAVVKKNAPVLERLIRWLDTVDQDVRRDVPVLVIDDEADQASPNTGGNRPPLDDSYDLDPDEEVVPPSRINELVRGLLSRFSKITYMAYTATPYANVLINHRGFDRAAGPDLYPRDFIVALPQPHNYYGAERVFGRADESGGGGELDLIRIVPDEDAGMLVPPRREAVEFFEPEIAPSLREAIDDFVLAGAARACRGDGDLPATMLIHTSYRTPVQVRLTERVRNLVGEIRDQWRYGRREPLEERLREKWNDFRRVSRGFDQRLDLPFDELSEHINSFVQQIEVRQLNSGSLDELDYDRDSALKVIVVGGNRLSRGLTLEGLLVSYYVRRALQYDTLMQMGRWFGYRDGYFDLTRIYTTAQLAQWFRDLATVEIELREEIERYRSEGLTPLELGVRIRTHASLLVTSPLKMGDADQIDVSFAKSFRQTITFPFEDLTWLRRNADTTRGFLRALGRPTEGAGTSRPLWRAVRAQDVLEFLAAYQFDPQATIVRGREIRDYIRRQLDFDELTEWVVAIMGPGRGAGPSTIDLGVVGSSSIHTIERTRLRSAPRSLKAIASPGDQGTGLSDEQIERAQAVGGRIGDALLKVRAASEGALLIYPISRFSGHRTPPLEGRDRAPIFPSPDQGEDVIGIALAFPASNSAATVTYLVGSVGAGR